MTTGTPKSTRGTVTKDAIARAAHRSGIRLWQGSIMDKYAEDHEGTEDKA